MKFISELGIGTDLSSEEQAGLFDRFDRDRDGTIEFLDFASTSGKLRNILFYIYEREYRLIPQRGLNVPREEELEPDRLRDCAQRCRGRSL